MMYLAEVVWPEYETIGCSTSPDEAQKICAALQTTFPKRVRAVTDEYLEWLAKQRTERT